MQKVQPDADVQVLSGVAGLQKLTISPLSKHDQKTAELKEEIIMAKATNDNAKTTILWFLMIISIK